MTRLAAVRTCRFLCGAAAFGFPVIVPGQDTAAAPNAAAIAIMGVTVINERPIG